MLLTINNLPSHISYSDVKALIQSKCGPLEVILDNLVAKNKGKSVTVGLADEEDAAILVRKINGLFMDGVQLYVEDTRKQKRKETYHSSDILSQHCDDLSGQTSIGFQSLQPQGVLPVMPVNQNMINYGIAPFGMYLPQAVQNAGFMGYGQQMMQSIPEPPMQNRNVTENLVISDTFQGTNWVQHNNSMEATNIYEPKTKKSRGNPEQKKRSENSQHYPHRDYSSQNNTNDDLRIENYHTKTTFDDKGRRSSRNRPYNKPSTESTNRKARDDRKDLYSNRNDRSGFGNSSHDNQERYPENRSNLNKRRQTNSQQDSHVKTGFTTTSVNKINSNSFDIPPLMQEFREHESSNYEPEYNEIPSSLRDYQYRDHPVLPQETRKLPSLIPEYEQRTVKPGSYWSDNKETSKDYRERQHEEPVWNNYESDHHRYSPNRNEFDSYDLDRKIPSDPWSLDINNIDRDVPQSRNCDDRKRHFDDDSYEISRSVHRHWAKNRSENFDDSGRSGGFLDSEEVYNDWSNTISPQRYPKPTFTNRKESEPSKDSRKFQDRRTTLKSEFKPRNDSRGPRNDVDKRRPLERRNDTTHTGPSRSIAPNTVRARPLTKKPYGPNEFSKNRNGSQSKLPDPSKFEKQAPKPHIQDSLTALIHKDATMRGQAASFIAKDMIRNFQLHKSEVPIVLKPLKASIRSRLELILGGDIATSMEEVVQKYRKKFNKKEDAAFFDAVLAKLENVPNKTTAPIKVGESSVVQPKVETANAKQPLAKSKAQNKPATSPGDKIPKFSNADKSEMKRQKQQAKLEFKDENMYELPEPLKNALDEDTEEMCHLFNNYQCSNDKEKKIVNIIKKKVIPDFKKAAKLNVTKRLLNISSNLLVRIFIHGKPPVGNEMSSFLKNYGVESCRKSKNGTFLVASCKNFNNYDKLLTMGTANVGGCDVSIKPLHIGGFKSRPSPDAVKKKRAAFLRQQIDADDSKVIADELENEGNENPDDLEDY